MTIQSRSPRSSLRSAGRLDVTVLGDLAGRLAQACSAASTASAARLADHAADFVVAAAAQLLGVKGRRAGEQFVEQHAQRIDVAAGVDVRRR